MDCFVCDDVLTKNYENLDCHMRDAHNIKNNRGFVLLLFVMEKPELADWSEMFQFKLDQLRGKQSVEGEAEVNSEDELALIQSQLDIEDISDDENETDDTGNNEGEDISDDEDEKENTDIKAARRRTILHVDGEKLLTEETVEIECIDIIDSDDDEESVDDPTTEIPETKPDVTKGMNKINLAEKFESLLLCRLCYQKCSDSEKLRRHEEIVHKNDGVQLKLNHFTLEDLKVDCERCQMKFLTRNILNIHSKLKHGIAVKETREDKTCEVCQRTIKYSSYSNHMKSHKEKGAVCKLCYRKFREERSLLSHLKSIHKNDAVFLENEIKDADLTFSCHACNLRFVSEHAATYHTKREHQVNKSETKTGNPIFRCYFCEDKFYHQNERKGHCWKIHGKKDDIVNESQVKCMVCDKIVSKKNHKNHKKSHLKISAVRDDRGYKCEFCPGEVFKKKAYKIHMKRLHNKMVKTSHLSFKCKLCYNQVQSKGTLKTHIKTVHSKDAHFLEREITDEDLQFPCTECPDKFVSESILKAHLRRHQNDEYEFLRERCSVDKSFQCNLCYTKFNRFSEMILHATSYHKEEIEFVKNQPDSSDLVIDCPECDLKFVSTNSVLYHRLKIHFSSDDTYCRLCEKTMKSQQGIFLHKLKVHQNELEVFKRRLTEYDRDKNCSRCDLKFYTEGSLEYHLRKEHSVSKKSTVKIMTKKQKVMKTCKLCYKKFKMNAYLTQHIKNIHNTAEERDFVSNGFIGELNYDCKSCDLKFLTESLLQKHSTKEHSTRTAGAGGAHKTVKSSAFCNLCYFDLKRVSLLEDHRTRIHTSAEEIATFHLEEVKFSSLKFDCSFCQKKLITRSALKYHRQYVHRAKMKKDANYEISCEYCGKHFKWKNRGNLKTHMKSVHDVKNYDVMEGTMEMENNKDSNVNDFMSLVFH